MNCNNLNLMNTTGKWKENIYSAICMLTISKGTECIPMHTYTQKMAHIDNEPFKVNLWPMVIQKKIQSRDNLYLFNVPRSMSSEIFFPDVNPKSLPACKCSGSSRDRKASKAVSCSLPRKSSVWKAREWLISLLHRMSPTNSGLHQPG